MHIVGGLTKQRDRSIGIQLVAHTLHLHEELSLDSPRRLALRVRAGGAEGVHFVDEDDGRLPCARNFEQRLHQPSNTRINSECAYHLI